ncbi:NERD domain-containing protein [Nocardia rhamnosiphila]|uniref:nuclease-related domain-containing protein n=1 Tax=Nocardia rhamnosiphila TaxID=426716 RepID=UPI0034114FFD
MVIVIVSNGVEVEDAEEMVRRLLESWRTGGSQVGGVAVLGCKVRHKRRVHSLDALVWTPYTCTVMEIKGFRSVQHGTLDPCDNGAWRVGGAVADLYSLGSAANPVAQAERYMYAVKKNFTPAGLPDWVHLLVVLAPLDDACLTITSSEINDGMFVVAASSDNDRDLRDYFTPDPGAKRRWSGEDLERAFGVLGLTQYLPGRQRLAQEGFSFARLPAETSAHPDGHNDPFAYRPAPMPPQPTLTSLPPAPRSRRSPLALPSTRANPGPSRPVGPPASDRGTRWQDADDPQPTPRRQLISASTTDQPRRPRVPLSERYPLYPAATPPAFAEPTARRWSQWPGMDTAISILAIIILAAALLILVACCGDARSATRTGGPMTPPAGQVQPSPAPPRPPPSTPNACMPFQAGC